MTWIRGEPGFAMGKPSLGRELGGHILSSLSQEESPGSFNSKESVY